MRGETPWDDIASLVSSGLDGARVTAPGTVTLAGPHGLEIAVDDDGISATFDCDGKTPVIGTTRRRLEPYPRLPWHGPMTWHSADLAGAETTLPPEPRRLLEEIAASGSVDVRIGPGGCQVHVSFRDRPASVEGVRAVARTIAGAVGLLRAPKPGADPLGGSLALPVRVTGARLVDLARFDALLATPASPLPDRDDPVILLDRGETTVCRAIVADFAAPVLPHDVELQVSPHEAQEQEGTGMCLAYPDPDMDEPPAPSAKSFRIGRRFTVKARTCRDLCWRLLWHSHLLLQGAAPVGPYPIRLLDHLGAVLPGARVNREGPSVQVGALARISLDGVWAGEATQPLPDCLFDWDPLERAGRVLFGTTLAFALGLRPRRGWRAEPVLRVEVDLAERSLARASRRRAASICRQQRLRLSDEGGRTVITARLWALSPSLVERRAQAALSVLDELDIGAPP
ncbi:MAG: hypothetical protein HYY06_17195 [Deltaproteobacteria bacterium]|nr:hypothetical protein [Deltaproteobacteria bacterium]